MISVIFVFRIYKYLMDSKYISEKVYEESQGVSDPRDLLTHEEIKQQ